MVKIETYDPYEIDIAYNLNEGDLTILEDVEGDFGTLDKVATFSKTLKKGDYVTLDKTADKTVKKAVKGDKIIGQIIDAPAWKGNRPRESKTYGNYTNRVATVRMNCDYIHSVKLISQNDAVSVGDSISYEGNNEFNKATAANDNIALKSAAALSGAKIPVAYGLRYME